MVLNNFGQSNKTRKSHNVYHRAKGEPGIGFNLTTNGDFDIQNKRLCNVSEPKDDTDVCTKGYVSAVIHKYDNTIQAVDNKHYSETSRLNAAIIQQGLDINDNIKQFSNTTQKMMKINARFLSQKINDVKDKLDTNIGDLLDIQRATTISVPTLINKALRNLEFIFNDVLEYATVDKNGFYVVKYSISDENIYRVPISGEMSITVFPEGCYSEIHINKNIYRGLLDNHPINKHDKIKFKARFTNDKTFANMSIRLLIRYKVAELKIDD